MGSTGFPPEVQAMLTVSRAMADGGALGDLLDVVATAAASVVEDADRSSIILVEGDQRRFRLAGSHGLSPAYRRLLTTGEAKLLPGEGPSGVAYELGTPVVVDDIDDDPRLATWTWRQIARAGEYRAIVSLPLLAGGTVVGTLNVYRTRSGPWPAEQVRVLEFFAQHAAGAVRTAQLLDARSRQLEALRRLVQALRGQTHEHANRLHAVAGLLALGEPGEARELLAAIESEHTALRASIDACIRVPAVAGLVLAEGVVAAQRGIRLVIEPGSRLGTLPVAVSESHLVTMLGNLLDNAFDAIAGLPAPRREVRLALDDRDGEMRIAVSDRGDGPPPGADVFGRGVSGKAGHAGLGLSLVRDAAEAALGAVGLRRRAGVTTVWLSVPS